MTKRLLTVPLATESIAEQALDPNQAGDEYEQLRELLLGIDPPWIPYSFLRPHLARWRSPIDLAFARCGVGLGMLLAAPIAEPTVDGTGNHPSSWPGTRLLPDIDEIAFEDSPDLAGLMLTVRAGLESPQEVIEKLQDLEEIDASTLSLLTAWIERKITIGSGRA